MSQTLDVIRRSFDWFYPKGSSVLIAGTKPYGAAEIHNTLFVAATRKKEVIDGITFVGTHSPNVYVRSFNLKTPYQLTEKLCDEIDGYDALMYVIDAVDVNEHNVETIGENIRGILRAMNEAKEDEPVLTLLVINSKDSAAKEVSYLSTKFENLLNYEHRKLFCVSPKNRLGLLKPIDFIGDQLEHKARSRMRSEWKEERKEARRKYDEKEEEKKDKRVAKRRRKKEKRDKEKAKFYEILTAESESGGDPVYFSGLHNEEEVEEEEEEEVEEEEEEEVAMGEENNEGKAEEEVNPEDYSSSTPEGYSSDSDSGEEEDLKSDSTEDMNRYSDTDPED